MINVLDLGLRLSLIGLGVTFLALGLVILVMEFLVRIFPGGRDEAAQAAASAPDRVEQRREETAVALAVSVALLEAQNAAEHRDPSLGKLLEE